MLITFFPEQGFHSLEGYTSGAAFPPCPLGYILTGVYPLLSIGGGGAKRPLILRELRNEFSYWHQNGRDFQHQFYGKNDGVTIGRLEMLNTYCRHVPQSGNQNNGLQGTPEQACFFTWLAPI